MMQTPIDDERMLRGKVETGREAALKNQSPIVDGKECCPNCGRPLTPLKCKLICECGYFMSCSDF